jgi:hypothetical protein
MAEAAARTDAAPAHDVAISFLVADEMIASEIKFALAGLNVFFYPHNQEELIGTNGIESMREPFLSARVNVILFRERYGNTPWTGVELTAIQDSCLKSRYQSLIFVQLDKDDQKPLWLPDTHIRCVLGDFSLEQLVGAIKLRVQERGGQVTKLSPIDVAKRLRADELLRNEEKKLFRDEQFIKTKTHVVVEKLMKNLAAQAQQICKEAGFEFGSAFERQGAGFRVVLRYRWVTLEAWWRQVYTNVMEDVALECTELNGLVWLQHEQMFERVRPQKLKQTNYYPVLRPGRELRWVEKSKPEQLLADDELVLRLIEQFLSLVHRADSGKIPASGR